MLLKMNEVKAKARNTWTFVSLCYQLVLGLSLLAFLVWLGKNLCSIALICFSWNFRKLSQMTPTSLVEAVSDSTSDKWIDFSEAHHMSNLTIRNWHEITGRRELCNSQSPNGEE